MNAEPQLAILMKSIKRLWTNPILIDEVGTILAGHARAEAARRLGMTEVPTITISGLSASEKHAVVIADNRLPELAAWDFDVLRLQFQDLINIDFDIELTGFSTGEVDLVIDGAAQSIATDPADDLAGLVSEGPAVTQPGDIWQLGRHRLVCGDAQRVETYQQVLEGRLAEMMVTDSPYNVRIGGHAMGRGKVRHREFAMASGEMTTAAFSAFLKRNCCAIAMSALRPKADMCSALAYVCFGPKADSCTAANIISIRSPRRRVQGPTAER